MVKTARALSPHISPKSSPPRMSCKGRMMGLCWECERSICICEKGSDDSVSLCSEDDAKEDGTSAAGGDLSFISEPPEAAPLTDSSSHAPHAPCATSSPIRPNLTPNSHQLGDGQSQQSEVKVSLPEKNVFVCDFTAHDPTSSTPDLSVYGVRAINDITIEPQCSLVVDTDVVIYGNHQAGAHTALFNFCPLVQNSPASVHGTRLATIAGGGVYVGHKGPKRLQVFVTNPGGFCKIFIPKGASLGVLEIYNHRY